jgi:hypothetical protein
MKENKRKLLKTNSIGELSTIGGEDLHCCRFERSTYNLHYQVVLHCLH